MNATSQPHLAVDHAFLGVAALCFVVAVCLGVAMGIGMNFTLAPVHGHLNLLGWLSMAVYGLSYRVYPSLRKGWLAWGHFGIACVGAVLFPVGLALELLGHGGALIVLGALSWLAGAMLFLLRVLGLMWRGHPIDLELS